MKGFGFSKRPPSANPASEPEPNLKSPEPNLRSPKTQAVYNDSPNMLEAILGQKYIFFRHLDP